MVPDLQSRQFILRRRPFGTFCYIYPLHYRTVSSQNLYEISLYDHHGRIEALIISEVEAPDAALYEVHAERLHV